jgi:hypothetical protein
MFCCFQAFFFCIECAPFLSKLAQGFKYWLIKRKNLKFLKFIFKTYLNAFALNMFLILKIMNFENMLTRVFYFILFKAWVNNINDLDQNVVKHLLY